MKLYRKKASVPMEPWTPETDMKGVSVSAADAANGSPRDGDMIAHNPADPADRWLVARDYFERTYEEVDADDPGAAGR